MSQSGHHPILTQLRHISIIGLNRDESESEWYIVIWDIHELTRPMLTPTQSHSWKIRHTPHHIEHHSATVLAKWHSHEVWAKILHF